MTKEMESRGPNSDEVAQTGSADGNDATPSPDLGVAAEDAAGTKDGEGVDTPERQIQGQVEADSAAEPRMTDGTRGSTELQAARQRIADVERTLAQMEKRLARADAARDESVAEAERQQAVAARRVAQIRELRDSLAAETTRAGQEQRRARAFGRENGELRADVETLQGKVKRLATVNADLTLDVERLAASTGLQLLTSPLALQWLTRKRERTTLKMPREVVVVGAGPVPGGEMERLLRKAGFLVRVPGDDSAALMVVGREEWLVDDLEEQIAARKSLGLKVFSQEMLIGALATRDDPFESADKKTLLGFADGHGALEYLIEAGFEWPFITWRPLQTAGQFAEKKFAEESPVHKLGYVVGKVAGLPDKARRRVLADAFTGKLPKVHSAEYMATWGTPGSRIRLRRMANHLATFARLWQNEPSFDTAVAHWEMDLARLHDEFYEPWMRFRWPETV